MALVHQIVEVNMTEKILPEKITFEKKFPKFKRRLRLGIVGGGRISQTQAMAARLTNRWEVVAGAFSSDPKNSKRRAEEHFISDERAYSSFEEMAIKEAKRRDRIDAVMITTPNHLHHEVAKVFIEAGIDVICDKPLTNATPEAEMLEDLLSKGNVNFCVCYTMSCFPMVRQARELVTAGKIGNINQIHVEFLQDWMVPEEALLAPHVKWRLDPKISGPTSCVGDIGTHAAHLAQFVSSLKLTDVKAEFHVCGAPKALEDTAFMMTRYEGGVPGTLLATRLATGKRGGLNLRIYGSEGGIEWNLESSEELKLSVYGKPDQTISRGHGHGVSSDTERLVRTARGFSEGIIEAWANLYSEFAIAVAARLDEKELPKNLLSFPTISEGVAGVRFIEASVLSNSKGGTWIPING